MNIPIRMLALAAGLLAAQAAFARGHIDNMDLLAQIRPGVTTAEEVRRLLGRPGTTMRFPREGIETLEYEGRDFGTRVRISISIDGRGTVRDVKRMTPTGP